MRTCCCPQASGARAIGYRKWRTPQAYVTIIRGCSEHQAVARCVVPGSVCQTRSFMLSIHLVQPSGSLSIPEVHCAAYRVHVGHNSIAKAAFWGM